MMRDLLARLRSESEAALRALYAARHFRKLLADQTAIDAINTNVHFWKLFEASLMTRLFIGIRRLYDSSGDAFTVQAFIKICLNEIGQFSSQALRQRKIAASPNADEWIDAYMATVHQCTEANFQDLARIVRDNSKKMKGPYTDFASKVYAHAIHTDGNEIFEMSKGLNYEEIEAALLSVWHLYQQVWQMFENGRAPELTVAAYPYADEVIESVNRQVLRR